MKSIVDYTNKLKDFFATKQALANEAVTRSKVGAHNLLPNDAVSSVFHGLTFTVNANGSISVSGQKDDASSHAYEICALFTLQAGTYTLSDGITDGMDNIDVAIYTSNGQTRLAWTRGTSHKETFTIASNTSCMAQINFRGATSTQFSYTVYPMLCLATDENTDYEPYAMTNKQLTDKVGGLLQMDCLAENYAATIGSWRTNINLSHSIDEYKLLVFSIHKGDRLPYASPQLIMSVAQFKTTSTSSPARVYYNLMNSSDASNILVSYVNSNTVGLFMGSDFTTGIRLAVFGIK